MLYKRQWHLHVSPQITESRRAQVVTRFPRELVTGVLVDLARLGWAGARQLGLVAGVVAGVLGAQVLDAGGVDVGEGGGVAVVGVDAWPRRQ